MSVTAYLDCGCAIMSDGSRSWCPTCSAGGPSVAPGERRLRDAAPEMLTTLQATRSYLWGELCRENLTTATNHPTAKLYRQVEHAIESATFGPEGKRG